MLDKLKSFLYPFDLIGTTPRLLIFNNERYKTLFTSFTSLLIIIFSFAFAIFSFVQYFKYENPNVVYSKSSDDITERSIFLKDTFFMFQLIETTKAKLINESIAYFTGDYKIIYDNGNIDRGLLYIERCEFGKNINSKYMNLLKSALNFGRPIEEFYCISSKSGNVSLFYNPNIGYSLINLNIMIKKK